MNLSGNTYQGVYDDEDRMVSFGVSGVPANTFVDNGLGLRVGKTDSTGTYTYLCDGTSPGASVLSDGHATYTPGLSERRGSTSAYYDNDRLGNLWTLNASGGSQLYYQDTTGFGNTFSANPTSATPFKFGGGNGCQTYGDYGLVLMGHRYYDTRIGRFISQGPIKSGQNWYAYCNDNPTNATDPSGFLAQPFTEKDGTSLDQIIQDTVANGGLSGETC